MTRTLAFVSLVLAAAAAFAQQPTWTVPEPAVRCPSRWGAGDEKGSMNLMTPPMVQNAAKLIRLGEVIELGHVLNSNMPMSATRQYNLHTKRTLMNPQSNQRGSNEELITAEMGQIGTQFDGFAHQMHRDLFYNCFKLDGTLASAPPPRSGSRSRIRCCWALTTAQWKSRPTPTSSSPCRCTRSRSW